MKVALIMGSKSDIPLVESAIRILKGFGVPFEVKILSAHRTPDDLERYIEEAEKAGVRVFIAAAGGAAHLPGVIASKTLLPVIGLPIKSKDLMGFDSILSIAQMPEGVPVATVGINRAKNAALLAIQMLALEDPSLLEKLRDFRQRQKEKVLNAEVNLDEI